MKKLMFSFLFSFAIFIVLAAAAYFTLQELRAELAWWLHFDSSIQALTAMLWRQTYYALIALLFSIGFALAFIAYAYVNAAYAAWEKAYAQ